MNLGEHLLACAERHPGAVALVDGERRATYGELLAEVRGAAGGLSARGVRPGDPESRNVRRRVGTVCL